MADVAMESLAAEAVDSRNGAFTWFLSLGATCVVSLSGILPLLVISPDMGLRLRNEGETGGVLRLLLGFAVGGLLGDVFFHLLPESVELFRNTGSYADHESVLRACGCWILVGLFTFVLVELLFNANARLEEKSESIKNKKVGEYLNSACVASKENGALITKNSYVTQLEEQKDHQKGVIHISGYLNLVANGIDNFSHGLAVAGSFLAGTQIGFMTTFAILLHEIPHEVGDFAILLKAGFSRWEAARAQLGTAAVGVLGTVAALSIEQVEVLGRCTSWILPFTAGGFINIALIGILPDLLKEKNPKESVKQFSCVLFGIVLMAAIQQFTH